MQEQYGGAAPGAVQLDRDVLDLELLDLHRHVIGSLFRYPTHVHRRNRSTAACGRKIKHSSRRGRCPCAAEPMAVLERGGTPLRLMTLRPRRDNSFHQ